MLLSRQAWDDLARHAPWLVWRAVLREQLLTGGIHICGDQRAIRAGALE